MVVAMTVQIINTVEIPEPFENSTVFRAEMRSSPVLKNPHYAPSDGQFQIFSADERSPSLILTILTISLVHMNQ